MRLSGWFDMWAGLPAPVRAAALAGRAPRRDVAAAPQASGRRPADGRGRVEWLRCLPFVALHVAALSVFWTGWSPVAVGVAVGLYLLRMFAITGFYHRYFSHRAFRAGRGTQFAFALIANMSAQRGPLWWAGHHRLHHRESDSTADPHSPGRLGFLWSHAGWFMSRENYLPRLHAVGDWLRFPELRFLDRFDWVAPLGLGALLYAGGELLARFAPALGTDGPQLLAWGIVSTIALFHATFTINSLAHTWGRRRYETTDTSRNNALLALLTLGEGWHNNHHHWPAAAPQGHRWWELDPTWWGLRALEALGLVRDLKRVPAHVLEPGR